MLMLAITLIAVGALGFGLCVGLLLGRVRSVLLDGDRYSWR